MVYVISEDRICDDVCARECLCVSALSMLALFQEFYLICLAPPPHAWQALAEESEKAQMHAWP